MIRSEFIYFSRYQPPDYEPSRIKSARRSGSFDQSIGSANGFYIYPTPYYRARPNDRASIARLRDGQIGGINARRARVHSKTRSDRRRPDPARKRGGSEEGTRGSAKASEASSIHTHTCLTGLLAYPPVGPIYRPVDRILACLPCPSVFLLPARLSTYISQSPDSLAAAKSVLTHALSFRVRAAAAMALNRDRK